MWYDSYAKNSFYNLMQSLKQRNVFNMNTTNIILNIKTKLTVEVLNPLQQIRAKKQVNWCAFSLRPNSRFTKHNRRLIPYMLTSLISLYNWWCADDQSNNWSVPMRLGDRSYFPLTAFMKFIGKRFVNHKMLYSFWKIMTVLPHMSGLIF